MWPIIGILGLMYLAKNRGMMEKEETRKVKLSSNPMDPSFASIRNIIAVAAKKYGVPLRVALAFAWLESRFKPYAEGDKSWAEWNMGERYRKNVLNNPKFADNPYRLDKKIWHSYGLFQLLAPYFVSGKENPTALLDPTINADRGVRKIANSLKVAGGDVRKARVIYAGAANLSADIQKELGDKIDKALELFPEDM